jgi:excisionase family DNA binding protein
MNRNRAERSISRQPNTVAQVISEPPDLLTVSEAAKLLRLSRRSIERLAARGSLPFFELPVRGGLRFDRPALLAWLARRHRGILEVN